MEKGKIINIGDNNSEFKKGIKVLYSIRLLP